MASRRICSLIFSYKDMRLMGLQFPISSQQTTPSLILLCLTLVNSLWLLIAVFQLCDPSQHISMITNCLYFYNFLTYGFQLLLISHDAYIWIEELQVGCKLYYLLGGALPTSFQTAQREENTACAHNPFKTFPGGIKTYKIFCNFLVTASSDPA